MSGLILGTLTSHLLDMETHGIMKAFPKVKRHRPHEGKDAPPVKKHPGQPVTGNVIYFISQMCAALVKIFLSFTFSNHFTPVWSLSGGVLGVRREYSTLCMGRHL